jgi:hypothetical protein
LLCIAASSRWVVLVERPVIRAISLMPSSGRRASKQRRIATARSIDWTPARDGASAASALTALVAAAYVIAPPRHSP